MQSPAYATQPRVRDIEASKGLEPLRLRLQIERSAIGATTPLLRYGMRELNPRRAAWKAVLIDQTTGIPFEWMRDGRFERPLIAWQTTILTLLD